MMRPFRHVGGMLVVSISVCGLVTLAAMTQPSLAPEAKHSLLQYVTGKYLHPPSCKVQVFDDGSGGRVFGQRRSRARLTLAGGVGLGGATGCRRDDVLHCALLPTKRAALPGVRHGRPGRTHLTRDQEGDLWDHVDKEHSDRFHHYLWRICTQLRLFLEIQPSECIICVPDSGGRRAGIWRPCQGAHRAGQVHREDRRGVRHQHTDRWV